MAGVAYKASYVLFQWDKDIEDDETRRVFKQRIHLHSMMQPGSGSPLVDPKGHLVVYNIKDADGCNDQYFLATQMRALCDHIKQHGGSFLSLPHEQFTTSITQRPSPVHLPSVELVHRDFSRIQKANKKAVGQTQKAKQLRREYLAARRSFFDAEGTWLSIDVESWERDQRIVTEIGWSVVTFKKGSEGFERNTRHIIVEEHEGYMNGTFVSDAKYRFRFGQSDKLSLKDAVSTMQKVIDHGAFLDGPLQLIFHAAKNDVDYLQKMGVVLPPRHMYKMYDTADLYAEHFNEGRQPQSLIRIGSRMGVNCQDCHNAGNDAHYTMDCFIMLCADEALKKARK